ARPWPRRGSPATSSRGQPTGKAAAGAGRGAAGGRGGGGRGGASTCRAGARGAWGAFRPASPTTSTPRCFPGRCTRGTRWSSTWWAARRRRRAAPRRARTAGAARGCSNPGHSMSLIEVEALTKDYVMGDVVVHALRSVSVAVERGEFVAVMGPSGAGEATFMKMLGCLDPPPSGAYRPDGRGGAPLGRGGRGAPRH